MGLLYERQTGMLAGLLPDIAADLDVTVGTAGTLTSAFAAGVIVGAPPCGHACPQLAQALQPSRVRPRFRGSSRRGPLGDLPCAVEFPYARARGARRACYALSGDGPPRTGVAHSGEDGRGTKAHTGR